VQVLGRTPAERGNAVLRQHGPKAGGRVGLFATREDDREHHNQKEGLFIETDKGDVPIQKEKPS
jgi:hypothetical protein